MVLVLRPCEPRKGIPGELVEPGFLEIIFKLKIHSMKKYIFLFMMFFALSLNLTATEPPQDATQQANPDDTVTIAIASNVPDSLLVVINGDSVFIPTKDGVEAAKIVQRVIEGNKGNWPTSPLAWVMWVLAFAFSATGIALMGNLKSIYNFLRIFLRETLHVVAFIAGAVSAGLTFLLGNGVFDWQTFATLWGGLSFLAVYVYERWIKKSPETVKK